MDYPVSIDLGVEKGGRWVPRQLESPKDPAVNILRAVHQKTKNNPR